jgi:hypothetical protein
VVFSELVRDDERYLTADDVLLRIVPAFRHLILDRARGEAEYRKRRDKYIHLNAPDYIVEEFALPKCRTVWVSLADGDAQDDWVDFVLWPGQPIEMDFLTEADRERLQPTVRKLAALLEYNVHNFE